MTTLLIPVFLPIAAGLACLAVSDRLKFVKETLTVLVSGICFAVALGLFHQSDTLILPWAGYGFDFALRIYPLSAFILLAIAGFGLLVGLYSAVFMAGKANLRLYHSYFLLTLGLSCGAVLADNLVLLLFFWGGLLVTLYTFISLGGRPGSMATAKKAFIINGLGDLCLFLGVAIVASMAGTLSMSEIRLPADGWGAAAFLLMAAGAGAKAGSMPFHTWIPDAALDAPLPFMAFLPAALEKLLGIYLLTRLSLDLFSTGPAMQLLLMTVGALTLVLAVSMALVQTDYKRLLSYHAVSQVGYMILGIGTGSPIGIAGGLFHMINHAIYKSCLFMTAGSVEHRTGTTDIARLGGLHKSMPVTGTCFLVAAAAISGIPPFNGFFSKELVFQGALDSGYPVFFWAAELGAVLTLASFLKLGHAVYFGERPADKAGTVESEWQMLAPMVVLAALCVVFGFGAKLPLSTLILPSMAASGIAPPEGTHFWGWHAGFVMAVSVGALLLAALNHLYGVSRTGKAKDALEHIHHAPVLKDIYEAADRRWFDPYDQGLKVMGALSWTLYAADRGMDWLTDALPARTIATFSELSRRAHNGSYPAYLAAVLVGFVIFAMFVGGKP